MHSGRGPSRWCSGLRLAVMRQQEPLRRTVTPSRNHWGRTQVTYLIDPLKEDYLLSIYP